MSRWLVAVTMTALASGIAALAGCENRQPPKLTLVDAAVTQVSTEAIAFDVAVDMVNPNQKELELREFRYTVSVDGRQVFQGRRSAQASLPAEGGKRVRLPGVVRYDQMNWPAPPEGGPPPQASYRLSGSLTYVVPGALAEILFDTGVRKPKVGFSGSGEVALTSAPPPVATEVIVAPPGEPALAPPPAANQ
jgi:hypothetical protein